MSNFEKLNDLLKNIKLGEIKSEDTETFQDLPDGYYLSEVVKAELTESKKSQEPMVKIQFKVVNNGVRLDDDGINLVEIPSTKNRNMFLYWVLKDEKSIRKFVSDMLKFEGSDGESLLTSEYFTNSDILPDALAILEGCRVYIQSSTSEYNNESSSWKNLISWKRANLLELP